MARLTVDGPALVVELGRWEKIGALHDSVRVPLSSVVDVRTSTRPWRDLRGLRAPGTGLPTVIALGTWRYRDGKDFVAVYGKDRPAVVVTLRDAPWSRLLVSASSRDAAEDTRRMLLRYSGH